MRPSMLLALALTPLGAARVRRDPPPARAPFPGETPALLGATCAAATHVWVSATRQGIPELAAPPGSCAAPAQFPIEISALVVDAFDRPVESCDVDFYVDFAS